MLEQFKADCSGKGLILLLSAQFGRMRVGKCIDDGDVDMGCQASVIDYMDRK